MSISHHQFQKGMSDKPDSQSLTKEQNASCHSSIRKQGRKLKSQFEMKILWFEWHQEHQGTKDP